MPDLFNRELNILAGPLMISTRLDSGKNQPMLQAKFEITKTNSRERNASTLVIWNLAEQSRAKLQETGLEVIVDAGYIDDVNQIYKGDIEHTTISRERVDWVTTVELGDGSERMKKARINESFRGPQTPGDMLRKAAKALGLDFGNLDEAASSDGARSVLKEFVSGFTMSGKVDDVIDELAESMGLTYSVQDKTIQLLPRNGALGDPPIALDASTGLIGSPSIGENDVVTAASLLNGVIRPGRRVNLDSAIVSGQFIAEKVQHIGETWGNEWTTKLEMVAA